MSSTPYTDTLKDLNSKYEQLLNLYKNLLNTTFEKVGFISGGFCPEPCEHTTLQTTDPKLYNELMAVWNAFTKTNELTEAFHDLVNTIITLFDNPSTSSTI